MKCQIEICCGSYYDALAAQKGNADRIELNSALFMGGLTPSLGSLILTKKNTDLKVITMIRPRGAGFAYNDEDFLNMLADTGNMMKNGADGIAFGILTQSGEIDIERCKKIIQLVRSYGQDKEIVFHRAFDCVSNPYKAIEALIELGVDRILTSGLQDKAVQGKALLKELQATYGDKIELLAGSGMNASNAVDFMNETGINQVHSSCKEWLKDATTTMNEVSYAYHEKDDYDVVSAQAVKLLVETCKAA